MECACSCVCVLTVLAHVCVLTVGEPEHRKVGLIAITSTARARHIHKLSTQGMSFCAMRLLVYVCVCKNMCVCVMPASYTPTYHMLHVEADEVGIVIIVRDVHRHVVHIPGSSPFRNKLAAPPTGAHASCSLSLYLSLTLTYIL